VYEYFCENAVGNKKRCTFAHIYELVAIRTVQCEPTNTKKEKIKQK